MNRGAWWATVRGLAKIQIWLSNETGNNSKCKPLLRRGLGNGNPLQYSFLENSMDRVAWWAAVCEITKSQTCEHTAYTLWRTQGKKTPQIWLHKGLFDSEDFQ